MKKNTEFTVHTLTRFLQSIAISSRSAAGVDRFRRACNSAEIEEREREGGDEEEREGKGGLKWR